MIEDFFKYALANMRNRKLRSWLTMIGIFIGIAAVVALVSLGQGLQKYIDEEFEKLGRDKIILMPKGQLGIGGTTGAVFTKSDVDAMKKVRGVADASGLVMRNVKLEFNDVVRYYLVLGMPTGKEGKLVDELFMNYGMEKGRAIKKGDKRKVALGHYYLDHELFERNVKLGDRIKINDVEFETIGFYELIGNPGDDQNVYIAEESLFELLEIEDERQDMIYAKAAKGEDAAVVSERIEKALRKHRNLDEGNEDFTVQSAEDMIASYLIIIDVINIVLIGIAAISLIVGGIGIMNTMFTSILERTNEIGIMKSIGARNKDIMILFLIESGILGLFGGAIGIAIGMGISKSIEVIATIALQSALLKAYFPWYLILGALMFSFLVGSLSGLVPAFRASRMSPVDALRYE